MSERVKQKMSEIDTAANDMQRELERDHIRGNQKKAFICASKCCDSMSSSAEDVQKCIQDCQKPLFEMQNAVKQELERFQNRIQRCIMSCQDVAQDNVTSLGKTIAEEKFNRCVYDCAEEYLKLLPGIKKRLIDALPK